MTRLLIVDQVRARPGAAAAALAHQQDIESLGVVHSVDEALAALQKLRHDPRQRHPPERRGLGTRQGSDEPRPLGARAGDKPRRIPGSNRTLHRGGRNRLGAVRRKGA